MKYDHGYFAALSCPTQVTWANDISKMFTELDIAHMKTKGMDLGDYDTVRINAVAIYGAVASGGMPPPGSGEQPWSQGRVNTFGCWIQQGCPK